MNRTDLSCTTPLADRRQFLVASVAAGSGLAVGASPLSRALAAAAAEPLFKISLAEWSVHNMINDGKLTNLEFPAFAKNECGIDAVEYVNQCGEFMKKGSDQAYLAELKQRCDDLGVTSVLIMCDNEGDLGNPDEAERKQAVENHRKWVEAAKFLGCHSIRVNARSAGSREEQAKLAADGLRQLSELAAPMEIGVIVENHGGWSSNGEWLAGVIKSVGLENCGTLPDFGNFQTGEDEWYDRYKGVTELMPFAKGVSAKSHEFDDEGSEVGTDYRKMLKIVLDAGYHGYVGVEWEGSGLSEKDGILATKQLLEKVRDELAASPS